jgi:hypothetical protein
MGQEDHDFQQRSSANGDGVDRLRGELDLVSVLYNLLPGRGMSKRIQTSMTVLLLATALAWTDAAAETEADADERRGGWLHEIRGGVLAHDVDHLWTGENVEDGVDLNAEMIFARPAVSALEGRIRLNAGASINTAGNTSKVYGGMLWEWEARFGLFFDVGLGLAVHNGELDTNKPDRKSLGSRVLFRTAIEVGYSFNTHHRIALSFDHVSNASLASPNDGMDTLGLRYCYRF